MKKNICYKINLLLYKIKLMKINICKASTASVHKKLPVARRRFRLSTQEVQVVTHQQIKNNIYCYSNMMGSAESPSTLRVDGVSSSIN